MKNRKITVFTIGFVLVALILAACNNAAPVNVPSSTPPPKPTTSTAPADVPTSPAAAFPTGRFNGNGEAMQFNPDGTFEFYTDASKIEPVFVGQYTVDGNLITSVNPDESDPKCKEAVAYQWAFDKNALTFSPTKEDPCRGRREANSDTYIYDPVYIPEIKISAADFSYIAPLKIRSGWVRVILTNTGDEAHHVQFLRLNDGVNVDQFEAALKQAEGPALAMTKQVGGVGAVAPGMTAEAVINLPAGEYVILCLIPSPGDRMAHHTKGMVRAMTVKDASGHGAEPMAGLTVHLKDFSFEMPDSLTAGPLTVQVINDGPEPHEFNILKLAEGKTAVDVIQFLNGAGGPPPFIPVGGMNGLDRDVSGYALLNLEPGKYVAICNIPSPKAEGHPHFALGMIKEFTVK